ncbi:endonuclease/exonuclease/phosphatase family protein [Bacteriovorax stolpii]|uniref:Uncharacterized protein n=1 Tax=Bacteriovorax stolpii TaxID=960 RepID=A0A2K9NUW3_BACTC|nr:endonuclease/exonuclease/phosphatase family protein [Bacteriovorax stolpii]AUN99303.1 hypothetical protein C0V70_14550 [Bacteriovorax stolpii]QDK40716.1 endonuclease/exonuclease/phosphatase family protein [Bacteriovorax stolpii]TDP55157.1 endonuclease/exonuclease/phosphatase (EEP) superfamily protein YafD [Bacteriovorax stolpii]
MKNFILSLFAVNALISLASSSYAQSSLAQSVFVNRPEVAFPVPGDEEVIRTFGKVTKNQLPPRKFKFLVWNLHKGTEDSFKTEYLSLAFDRDIVMNQEVFLDPNMMDVFRYLPNFYFTTATSFFSGKEKVRTGVANISAVKPAYTEFIRTETLEPVVNSPKVALITSYPIRFSTKELTVVNLHGINFVSTKSFRHELNRIYERIKDIPSPLVFSGDFNTWNRDRISILEEYAQKLNLVEARFLPDNRMTFNGYPLDHFLHTKDLKVTRAKVDGDFKGSDHKPLQVEVEYSPLKFDFEDEEFTQDLSLAH